MTLIEALTYLKKHSVEGDWRLYPWHEVGPDQFYFASILHHQSGLFPLHWVAGDILGMSHDRTTQGGVGRKRFLSYEKATATIGISAAEIRVFHGADQAQCHPMRFVLEDACRIPEPLRTPVLFDNGSVCGRRLYSRTEVNIFYAAEGAR